MTGDAWLRRFGAGGGRVDQRIVCCPHAGGSASFFRGWSADLSATTELWAVQYPGHEDRIAEPCADDLHLVAERVAAAVAPLLDRPLLVFGHSMGAVVAYEVARRIERATPRARITLVVSAAVAPGQWQLAFDPGDDDALIEHLRTLDGSTAEVLDDPEMRELVLPPIRSDYRAMAAYRHQSEPRLRRPILAIAGDADPAASPAAMAQWRSFTTGRFALSTLPGGHFYLVAQRAALLRQLTDAAPPGAG
jgi:pyochelin biosynthetic protein PchC